MACDFRGRPIPESNLGRSIGSRGLTAPGEAITSLGPAGALTLGGTSVAVPFVTGAIALLLSEFPSVTPAEIRLADHSSVHCPASLGGSTVAGCLGGPPRAFDAHLRR